LKERGCGLDITTVLVREKKKRGKKKDWELEQIILEGRKKKE